MKVDVKNPSTGGRRRGAPAARGAAAGRVDSQRPTDEGKCFWAGYTEPSIIFTAQDVRFPKRDVCVSRYPRSKKKKRVTLSPKSRKGALSSEHSICDAQCFSKQFSLA